MTRQALVRSATPTAGRRLKIWAIDIQLDRMVTAGFIYGGTIS